MPVLAGPVSVNRHIAAVSGVLRLILLVGDEDSLDLVQLLLGLRLILVDVDSRARSRPLCVDIPDCLWAHWRDKVALVKLFLVKDRLIGAGLHLIVL